MPDSTPPDPRRVLLLGSHIPPDSMESHVLEALRALGCTAEFCPTQPQWGRLGNAIWHKIGPVLLREPELRHQPRLLRQAARFAPDLVLVLQGSQTSPKTVAALREQLRVPIVCWCQDQMTALGRQYLLGAEYDAVFVKDRYMLELFSSMIRSTRFHYLPEACNPRAHRSLELSEAERARYGCEVAIFGSLYYYRQEILRQLGPFDLKIWGGRFDWLMDRGLSARHMGREVVLDDKVRAMRAARIALNPLHYAEVDGLNCRAFELAGCGAFQLVTARPALSRHFIPGVELDCFSSIDELIAKIRYYLDRPEEASAIARRGQRRAHAEHTYEARLREIFDVVFGKRPVSA